MDIDYSPTGKEFVSCSYDKTIRIWKNENGKSRDTYHGKRMQKVFSVQWTSDGEYLISGSEDSNIRIWKSTSHKKEGIINERESSKREYYGKLIDRFEYNQELKKIKKSHLPKYLLNHKRKDQIQIEKKHRKIENMKINNENEFEEPKPEIIKNIVKTE